MDKKEKALEIKYEEVSVLEYNRIFSGGDTDQDDVDDKKAKKALEIALDIRKFEIDLYWKRATYFWAFIAVMFAGYFSLLKEVEHYGTILTIICCLGLVFSMSWYMVNKSSKFWQCNWEHHVDLLEDKINGPIYKTIICKSGLSVWNPASEYAFSMSKINQMVSFFIVIVWGILTLISLAKIVSLEGNAYPSIGILLLTCMFVCYMIKQSKSDAYKFVKLKKDGITIIRRK